MPVSVRRLAQLAGVNPMTVSRALRGRDGVGEELRRKILALARKHGYPMPAARAAENPELLRVMAATVDIDDLQISAGARIIDFDVLPTDDPDSAVDPANALFTQRGHWAVGPVNWSDPEGALESEAFWQILSKCLSNLPKRLQACFQMWEVDGLDTQEVCKELSMTETNLWVSLHRARLKLRGCLESNWFQDTEEK